MRRSVARRVVVALIVGSALALAAPLSAGLPEVDTTEFDVLDAHLEAAGTGSDPVPGGVIDLFNGNFMTSAPSSPSIPVDLQRALFLSRTYNSKKVKLEQVKGDDGQLHNLLTGRSWLGLGWTSHFGRILWRSEYSDDGGSWDYESRPRYYEAPNGSQIRYIPSINVARPSVLIQRHQNYECVAPPQGYCEQYPLAPGCELVPPCIPQPQYDYWYTIKFPDGTVAHLEELVPASEWGTKGWVENHDRVGYYTKSITNTHGNAIHIEYWGEVDPSLPFPEAIKSVYVDDDDNGTPEKAITTSLCDATVDSPSRCPAEADGMLKTVHATGFNGATVEYQFYYDTVSIAVDGGTVVEAVLSRVELPEVGGSSVGEIEYEYETGMSREATSAQHGPLLTRITQPTGAVTELKYGTWVGGNLGSPQTDRDSTGVVKATVFPDGLGAQGNGDGMSHFSWEWDRAFESTCATDEMQANSFQVTLPDGRTRLSEFYGNPCGTAADMGPYGSVKSTTVFEADGTTALRTTTYGWDDEQDSGSTDYFREIVQQVTTTFEDDTGGCFGSIAGGAARTVVREARERDSWSRWELSRTSGDYFPDGWERVEKTKYYNPGNLTPTCTSGGIDRVLGAVEWFAAEEHVGSSFERYERSFDYSCTGEMTEARTKVEFITSGITPADFEQGTFAAIGAASDDDLIQATQYAPNGEPSSTTVRFNNLTQGNEYTTAYQWNHGQLASADPANQAVQFLTTDNTIDASGLVSESRDPNGLASTMAYDAVGRLTEVAPPDGLYPLRQIYPSLNETIAITSAGSETAHLPSDPGQRYTKEVRDGLGRVIERWRSYPDPDTANSQLALQVIRYDQVGRVIFVSEWLEQGEYDGLQKVTWESGVDADNDSVDDYRITGVPLLDDSPARPWGRLTFYGTPDAADPTNPLKITPDGLGRVVRVEQADGSGADIEYCGPHRRTTIEDIAGQLTPAVTTEYYDGLGRLVVVDAPAGSIDAEYTYNSQGRLVRVNLVDLSQSDPFEDWRSGTIPDGQIRTFAFDAAGRLLSEMNPESGTRTIQKYDPAGNVLEWTDQKGTTRGYKLQNTYDAMGRLTQVDKVDLAESSRLSGSEGGFEDPHDLGFADPFPTWVEGTIDGNSTFTPADSSWAAEQYANLPCVEPPPGQTTANRGLVVGSNCSYSSVPSTGEAVRLLVTTVNREEWVSLNYWRHVRSGLAGKDRFKVVVSLSPTDLSGARTLFYLDSEQESFATWRRTPAIRLLDVFSDDPAPAPLYLFIVFEKGDTESTGLGSGVVVDDVFVGRRSEQLAAYEYDIDVCDGTITAACLQSDVSTSRFLGKLSRATGYENDRVVTRESYVYRGRGGAMSGVGVELDWRGQGALQEIVHRWRTDAFGGVEAYDSPWSLSTEIPRTYELAYRNGYLDGLREDATWFLRSELTPASVEYSASGVVTMLRYANGASQLIARDEMSRPSWIHVNDAGGNPIWEMDDPQNSANDGYRYDGGGNIYGIGAQTFEYDHAGRLTQSVLQRQASDPSSGDFTVDYSYDPFGNLESRSWSGPVGETAPSGFEVDYASEIDSATNRLTTAGIHYDESGNMTRTNQSGIPLAAAWGAQGTLTGFYHGDPDAGGARPAEWYSYDSTGARVLKFPVAAGEDGIPVISIRGPGGEVRAEFRPNVGTGELELATEYVYGAGRMLAERHTVEEVPTLAMFPMMKIGDDYVFMMTSGDPFASYTIDIRAASGYQNQLVNETPVSGRFYLDESDFSPGEANYVRFREESTELTAFSVPITLAYDPTVDAQSQNQVRSVAVHRDDTDIVVTYALLNPNGATSDILFVREDTGQPVLQVVGLSPTTMTATISNQSQPVPCGSMVVKQNGILSGAGADVPAFDLAQTIGVGGQDCGRPEEPVPPTWSPTFATLFAHRDHLGSLRVVTDDAGQVVSAHDYYAFGLELIPAGVAPTGDSTMRYTVHERDSSSNSDYMMARYKLAAATSFISPDTVYAASPVRPYTWNQYSYVENRPVQANDPTGQRPNPYMCGIFDHGCNAGGGMPRPSGEACWGAECGLSPLGSSGVSWADWFDSRQGDTAGGYQPPIIFDSFEPPVPISTPKVSPWLVLGLASPYQVSLPSGWNPGDVVPFPGADNIIRFPGNHYPLARGIGRLASGGLEPPAPFDPNRPMYTLRGCRNVAARGGAIVVLGAAVTYVYSGLVGQAYCAIQDDGVFSYNECMDAYDPDNNWPWTRQRD